MNDLTVSNDDYTPLADYTLCIINKRNYILKEATLLDYTQDGCIIISNMLILIL